LSVELREGQILKGPLFNDPMRVITVRSDGGGSGPVGHVGVKSERFRNVALSCRDLASLAVLEHTAATMVILGSSASYPGVHAGHSL
jgi:hypothetical protein